VRVRSMILLLLIVVVVSAAGYYLTVINPVTDDIDLGLDLVGGIRVVYEPVDPAEATDQAMNQAVETIRFRVDKFGVAEPLIRRATSPLTGTQRIIVELPGVKNADEARRLIGKTAMLEFVDESGQVIVSGKDLVEAQAMYEVSTNRPIVTLSFNAEGRDKFAAGTSANVGKIIFILFDKEVLQAPTVMEPITNGEAQISGYLDIGEAQQMASLLNSGALPLELKMVENRTISATLGSDSVNDSVRAGLIGILAVAAFMLLFYRLPGLVANFALAIYVLIVVVVLAAINATLTLPGIAGIILSVGMAVDANVIIFERVKEELRNGKTIGSAVESGFRRALWTIIDANVTTLIGAAVLIKFATGPVQGFGVTLGIGILASMLTAVLITRLLMRLVVQSGAGNWQFLFFGRQGVREA